MLFRVYVSILHARWNAIRGERTCCEWVETFVQPLGRYHTVTNKKFYPLELRGAISSIKVVLSVFKLYPVHNLGLQFGVWSHVLIHNFFCCCYFFNRKRAVAWWMFGCIKGANTELAWTLKDLNVRKSYHGDFLTISVTTPPLPTSPKTNSKGGPFRSYRETSTLKRQVMLFDFSWASFWGFFKIH